MYSAKASTADPPSDATSSSPAEIPSLSDSSLRDFLESGSVSMHSVSANGTILWANQAELDFLGYSHDEYVGHHIANFHVDPPVIEDILRRLRCGETLRAYPARLRHKDGSIRHIALDSSALFRNGEFVHSRCITRDISREVVTERRLRAAEKFYRDLLEALPVAIYTTDAEGLITHYNQEAVQVAGRQPEAGKDRWSMTHRLLRDDGTFLPHEECPMAVALKTGEPVRGMEVIAERPDGSRTHYMPYATPWRDEQGRVIGGVNVMVDISERKRAEESRGWLAAIVDTSEDAIISKNLDGIIQTWNAGAERIFGYRAEEAIGQSVTILIPAGHDDEEPYILARIRRGERIEHYETVRRRKDGTLRDISLTVSPILDKRGKIIGASKIARDITERKHSESDLRRANADLEQFAYSASHDLQEPVRNVAVYAEILNRRFGQSLDSKGKEALGFIQESAKRMSSLIHSLLAYVQSGGRDEGLQEIDARAALAAAATNLTAMFQETGAEVTQDRLPILRMRPGQLEHVFQNLIGNAIKYRSDNTPPRIHVSAKRAGDYWQFAVKDNGIGIPPEFQGKIFRIFKRLHDNSKYSGSGIGLAICQRIVEMHGGKIWVESEGDGRGSTFYFTLPDHLHMDTGRTAQ